MATIAQHFIVTVRSDGRYTNEELAAHIAGRAWNINGVAVHGVDAVSIEQPSADKALLTDVVKAGEIVISTEAMAGIQVIQWHEQAPPMAVGDRVFLLKKQP